MVIVSVLHKYFRVYIVTSTTFIFKGRVALDGYTGKTDITRPGPTGFGVHTINCTHHPYGELSLADVENIFEEKFGDMSVLDGFMDFNLGLWTNDLSTYVR